MSLCIVVDTNVIIRGTLSATGSSALILDAIKRRRCILVSSPSHLSELYGVLARPRMQRRYGITERRRKHLVARLFANAIWVSPKSRLRICRDPNDDYLIEMALLSHATHLVTEDADLHSDVDIRALLQLFGVRLVHANEFMIDLARDEDASR